MHGSRSHQAHVARRPSLPMKSPVATLSTFLAAHPASARVEVREALGSTPREAGAWMLVSPGAIFGTIGGGQLEFMAIDAAREMLAGVDGADSLQGAKAAARTAASDPAKQAASPATRRLSIPLGPEIGQCCGGRVDLDLTVLDDAGRQDLLEKARMDEARLPVVHVFGGGHVGHALAAALALLPVRCTVVETRQEALEGLTDAVEKKLTAVPEEVVRDAPQGSAFVVLTHDHALDFLIVAEALARDDAAYVGMIGSATKKATFRSWYLRNGGTDGAFTRLACPIGGAAVRDKRPAVIAALAGAEIMTALATRA